MRSFVSTILNLPSGGMIFSISGPLIMGFPKNISDVECGDGNHSRQKCVNLPEKWGLLFLNSRILSMFQGLTGKTVLIEGIKLLFLREKSILWDRWGKYVIIPL
jgi:hypothetical protein